MTESRNTPWRTLGTTTLAAAEAEIKRIAPNSPLLPVLPDVLQAAGPHARLMLAMAYSGSKYATLSSVTPSFHNFLHLAKPEGGAGQDRWLRFGSYAECAKAWRDRITSPTYKAGVYARTVSIADLIYVYAPPNDSNDTERYIAEVLDILARLPKVAGTEQAGDAPPAPVDRAARLHEWLSQAGMSLSVDLLPATLKTQRPGYRLNGPAGVTIHETGNPAIGADAIMHRNWLAQGARNAYGPTQTSFHLIVDDVRAIQMVPLDEVAWHAGDGSGPGNFSYIAFEHCVNAPQNSARWRAVKENGARIVAALHIVPEAFAWNIKPVSVPRNERPHQYFSGKNCPARMLAEGGIGKVYIPLVNRYVEELRAYLAGTEPPIPDVPSAPTYATPDIPAILSDTTTPVVTYGGADMVLVEDTYRAKVRTPRYQYADRKAPGRIGPDIEPGEEFLVRRVFKAGDGEWYGITPFGTRVFLADLERVRDVPLDVAA